MYPIQKLSYLFFIGANNDTILLTIIDNKTVYNYGLGVRKYSLIHPKRPPEDTIKKRTTGIL